ncbi:hypothetical protein [Flavobacterium terrigena]|uniref:Uncharacterized protein n=1 Tax=Flavobacterium terrigena TaxID=402734 RepID=A0A1H6SHY6_9FLAO|nr:hypothetical protein [Flavobacterium terrigena]SEI63092.1 hypothetical protein SAMN05660918_1212 [Flavobacterium terrigena]
MFPIYIDRLRTGEGISVESFVKTFKEICTEHQKNGNASSFVFIIHDFTNPEITKVLEDRNYFNALDEISGNNLTIFYLHLTPEKNKRVKFLGEERLVRDMTREMNDFLIQEFKLEETISTPAILFFQIKNKEIIDFFFCSLTERTTEKAFLEIENLVQKNVSVIKQIATENKQNYPEIFTLIKNEIDSVKTIKTVKSRAEQVYNFGKVIVFIEKFISSFV